MKIIFPALFLLFWLPALTQTPPSELFLAGNDALERGEAATAIQEYERALAADLHSAELYHNLGLAYLRLDRTGPAVYQLSRAAQLAPGNAAIDRSLQHARGQIVDRLPVIRPFVLVRWFRAVGIQFSATTWAILAQVLIVAGIGLLVYWLVGSHRVRRKQAFYGALSLLPLIVLCFSLAAFRTAADRHDNYGVLLTNAVLYEAPDATSPPVRSVTEGNSFSVEDRIGEWYQVTLSNGEPGWLEAETIGLY